MEIKLEVDKNPNLDDLALLFQECGFNQLGERATDRLDDFLRNSSCFVCAYVDGRLVGFVRLFTDWVSRGYLCDLCVFPAARGKGIGRTLMQKMLSICDARGLPILNFSDFRGHKFYDELGFKSEKAFHFMYRINPEMLR